MALSLDDGTFVGNAESAALLRDIGGSKAIMQMTSIFYQKMFKDPHLRKFVMNEDDPHAERLGNWIVEKMGGEGQPWTEERRERWIY